MLMGDTTTLPLAADGWAASTASKSLANPLLHAAKSVCVT